MYIQLAALSAQTVFGNGKFLQNQTSWKSDIQEEIGEVAMGMRCFHLAHITLESDINLTAPLPRTRLCSSDRHPA